MADEKDTALDGLRVLEVTQGLAGSLCGRLMGELGAEVIKIEPPAGDNIRNLRPFKSEKVSYLFGAVSVNKKGMTLDLSKTEGKEILKELVNISDIFIEDHPVGTLDGLGIGYETLNKVNPQLIYCSMTPFGQNSPLSYKETSDIVVQAMSGMMITTGLPTDPPTKAGFSIGDFISSVYALIGILAAVHYREGSERGQAIDISMSDCLLSYFATYIPPLFMTGTPPQRRGNRHTMNCPWNAYEAKDGWVIICTAGNDEWNRLLEVMGRNDLVNDPRYDTNAKRVEKEDALDDMVNTWTQGHRVEELMNLLEEARVGNGCILNIDQLLTDEHFLSRQMLVEVGHPLVGKMPVINSVFKMSETPGVIRTAAPILGQHTEELLSGLLNYRQKDIEDLKARGDI